MMREAHFDVMRRTYETEMYGFWHEGEQITYELKAEGARICSFFGDKEEPEAMNLILHASVNGRTATWELPVFLPKTPAPAGGYPFIVSMHDLPARQYALEHGYAMFVMNAGFIASDNMEHKGSFYDLYPYTSEPESQTGVLMAWAWGASKVLDAVAAGLGRELNLNPELSIVTGVSRWGKATAVCGAFEKRFRLVAPACSGAGGLALYKYMSEGKTYDLTAVGASKEYTYGQNEPLSCLQSEAERGWFTDRFLSYKTPEEIPFDQYELAALGASERNFYFVIAACTSEDWVNAPSMWECYKEALKTYDELGLSDHFVLNFHKEGHAVLDEDLAKLFPYFEYMTGQDTDAARAFSDRKDEALKALHTCVFAGQE